MPSRKRQRTERSPESDDPMQVASDHNMQLTNDPDKEEGVWEAFRDEHVEAIEQVPLALHRQCALMNELDQQASAHTANLLPMLVKYIKRRRELAHSNVPSSAEADRNSSASGKDVEMKEEQARSPLPTPGPTSARTESTEPTATSEIFQSENPAIPRMSTPLGLPPDLVKSATTTRQMLSHIAGLAEELLRASEEKVNVAQAAYDSVDRHVRILQQAIKDQEASITLGARPGHLEPENLSDLAVGRWVRPSRATLSPINSEDLEGDNVVDQENDVEEDLAEEIGRMHLPPIRGPGKKGRGRPKGPRPKSDDAQVQGPPLTITLPAHSGVSASDVPEETYCYCQQGSFGEMIACDNKKCPREWYHVGCVGLKTTPEGMKTWYCPDCKPARRGGKRK